MPDCKAIFDGDQNSIAKSKTWTSPCPYPDDNIVIRIKTCADLKNQFQFLDSPSSREEADFPLAFVLVVEKEAEQVIRLLSIIYQPQNLYCLTYDQHASLAFKRAMNLLFRCFPNNLVTPKKKREIYWADFSIIESTMDCVRLLAVRKSVHDWKYVQIVSWNDMPLKTNLETVRILKIFNGSNDVELSKGQSERLQYYYDRGRLDEKRINLTRSIIPPNNLTVYKGSYAATLSRDFVTFLVNDRTANLFFEWLRPTFAPEEQFWSTLVHNIQLKQPGGFPGSRLREYNSKKKTKDWISRYQTWYGDDCRSNKTTFSSCVFGVEDLPFLKNQVNLMAHKFYMNFEPATSYCMHWRLFEKRRLQLTEIDLRFYENLDAVRYQKLENKTEFVC